MPNIFFLSLLLMSSRCKKKLKHFPTRKCSTWTHEIMRWLILGWQFLWYLVQCPIISSWTISPFGGLLANTKNNHKHRHRGTKHSHYNLHVVHKRFPYNFRRHWCRPQSKWIKFAEHAFSRCQGWLPTHTHIHQPSTTRSSSTP